MGLSQYACVREGVLSEMSGKRILIDLSGKRFGAWTVLRRSDIKRPNQTRWDCRCDCGTLRNVGGERLRSGKSKSCGCQKARFLSESKSGQTLSEEERKVRGDRLRKWVLNAWSNPEFRKKRSYELSCLHKKMWAENYEGRRQDVVDSWKIRSQLPEDLKDAITELRKLKRRIKDKRYGKE